MPRNLPFATTFPKYHPRAGEPTNFASLVAKSVTKMPVNNHDVINEKIYLNKDFIPKFTTIRAGNRWKVGDLFTPVVWSGRPYHSKQIKICEPIKIHSVHTFQITKEGHYWINGSLITLPQLKLVALNDGFTNSDDFECWFSNVKTFEGQILCWDVDIKYDFLPF